MATSFTTHSAGQVITSADVNLIQTAVNALESTPSQVPGTPLPTQMGVAVKAWNYDPFVTSESYTPSVGVLNLTAIYVPSAITINNIYTAVSSTSATVHGLAAVYTWANLGARLGVSSDITTAAGTPAGLVTYTLTAPLALSAGTWYYVGFFVTGTAPQMLGRTPSTAFVGLNLLTTANQRRAQTADTGLTTTMPATLGAQAQANSTFWTAIG